MFNIYLLHWLVTAVIAEVVFDQGKYFVNHWITGGTIIVTVAVSLAISRWIDAPVNALRKKIKQKKGALSEKIVV